MAGNDSQAVPRDSAGWREPLAGPKVRQSRLPDPKDHHWLLKSLLAQRPWSLVASVSMALGFVMWGLIPVVVGHAIDEAVASHSVPKLGLYLGLLAVVYALSALFQYSARYFLMRSELLVGHDLRMAVTDRIQDPRGLAGRRRTPGELLSIASADTRKVSEAVMMTVFPVAELTSIIYVSAMMALTVWWLGVATLLAGPVIAFIAVVAARPLQSRSLERQRSVAAAAAMATDVVQGLRILKGLGAVEVVTERYFGLSRKALDATVSANAAQARLNAITELVGSIFTIAVGLVAGWLALSGTISIGQLITLIGLMQFIITPMTMFGRNLASRWASASASSVRVRDLLGAEVARGQEESAEQTRAHFAEFGPGLHVVSGLSSGDKERIHEFLAGNDRSVVLADPHASELFDGTIAYNIGGDAQAVRMALEVASATDIPGGADREVGEEGNHLSGGQRQRVALARAVASDAEILVLDDPTTAVDSVTESRIVDNFIRQRSDRVNVVMSQSPAWRARATRNWRGEQFLKALGLDNHEQPAMWADTDDHDANRG